MIKTRDDLDRIGELWVNRITSAEKRDHAWITAAERAEAAYLVEEDEGGGGVPDFNILHANVATITPTTYNSTGTPDIRPRHNNDDPVAKMGGDIIERCIATMIDNDRMSEEVEITNVDAEVAGRGVTRVKFDADDADNGSVTNERLIYENVSWRDYREGDAKKWADVPWVAFGHFISQEQRDRLEDEDYKELYANDAADPELEEKSVRVWECWEKSSRKVFLIVEESARVINIKEDPLKLDGFYPIPKPVQPITGSGKRTPVCPYEVYRKQAEELDRITKRINAIISGLKVRGIIAADADVIQKIAELGDNDIGSVGNIENLVAAGGLEKAVMWWPVDKAIAVLRELYVQREQCKQIIFELTGISDIVRGQSAASETATAQEIKARAGSLRVKKKQRAMERHVRDLFQISAEIIANVWSTEGIQQAAGMPVDPQVEALIRSPMAKYRIDVESDSTVRADMTDQRREQAEFLQATGQFFNTMAPVVAQAPETAVPMVEVYSSFARQFNLGAQAEAALDKFSETAKKAAGQPRPNPEAEKAKAEMAMKGQEMQAAQAARAQELQLAAVSKVEDRKQAAQTEAAKLELARWSAAQSAKADQERLRLEREKFEFERALKVGEFEMESERAEGELDKNRRDYEAKEQEVAAIAARFILPLIEQMRAESAEASANIAASVQAMRGEVAGAMGQMAAAMTAGTDIVRENGRVVGSRSRYDGAAEGIAAPVIEAITREKRINGDMVN